jgi:hypothetical protein
LRPRAAGPDDPIPLSSIVATQSGAFQAGISPRKIMQRLSCSRNA